MILLLTIIHVFVCFFLILVVLLQTGKGADVAAAFGGSTQTAFGARGTSTFLSKMTTVSAVMFMFTSLTLALLSSGPSSSVVEKAPAVPAPASLPAQPPAAPAAPPAAPGTSGGDAASPPPRAEQSPAGSQPQSAVPAPTSPAPGQGGTPQPGSGGS